MELDIFIVDAFTDFPFKGNPAGVCLLSQELDDNVLQNIAAEMNLSETAFLLPKDDLPFTGNKFLLRWFTPTIEVDLCGHATLASGHVLLHELNNQSDLLKFETRSGLLEVEKLRKLNKLQMRFPLDECEKFDKIPEVNAALNLKDTDILDYQLSKSQKYLTIELLNPQTVKSVRPDFNRLKKYDKQFLGGVIVTSTSLQPDYDFVSRFFTPWFGINEDPVTGSAHTVLGPYWSKKLGDKRTLRGQQVSQRTGLVETELLADKTKILLRGQAVTVVKGIIII